MKRCPGVFNPPWRSSECLWAVDRARHVRTLIENVSPFPAFPEIIAQTANALFEKEIDQLAISCQWKTMISNVLTGKVTPLILDYRNITTMSCKMFHLMSSRRFQMAAINFSIFSVDTMLPLQSMWGETKGLELRLCCAGIILLWSLTCLWWLSASAEPSQPCLHFAYPPFAMIQ